MANFVKMWLRCRILFILHELLIQFPSALGHVWNRLSILHLQLRELVKELFQWLQLLKIAEKWVNFLFSLNIFVYVQLIMDLSVGKTKLGVLSVIWNK